MRIKGHVTIAALGLTIAFLLLTTPAWAETYHGNQNSLVFHGPGCKDYNCPNCVVNFSSIDDALRAGFRPHTACVSGASISMSAPPASFSGTVTAVIDGDTIKVKCDGESAERKIRIYGIDAPEDGQAHGKKAGQAMAGMVGKKLVQIEIMQSRDKYGRIVGIVRTEDGEDAGLQLLKAGYAWVFPKYCMKYAPCTEYWAAENQAREARIGLWQDKKPVPPWEWRK